MSTTPPSTPSTWQELLQVAADTAQAVISAVDPADSVIVGAINTIIQAGVNAYAAATGTPVTVANLQALLPDVVLVPPPPGA